MSAPLLQFRVAGKPIPQGSKSASGYVPKGGGRTRARLYDDNEKTLKPWREEVKAAATQAAGPEWVPIAGPLRAVLLFAMPKPISAPKRRRTWPIGKGSGDGDKLTRAVFDAITDAGVWGDDAQVVWHEVRKDYPEHVAQNSPGVIVRIWRVEDGVHSTGSIPLPIAINLGDLK